jgi:hypothetical protein
LGKIFLVLPWCFAQDLLKIRNEMPLTAVAQIIGNRCPIGLVSLADLLCRCQKPVTLEQPFETNAKVIQKELLQPAFASMKGFGYGCNDIDYIPFARWAICVRRAAVSRSIVKRAPR